MSAHAEQSIFASILKQRQIVKEAASSSKQRRRREKIPVSLAVAPATSIDSSEGAARMTEIKPYPVEIWEGE